MGVEVIANCIIRNEKGKILLVKEKKDWYYKLPGGKVEEGETLEETAIRETLEEIGIKVEILKQFNTYEVNNFKKRDFKFYVYEAKIISGTPEVKESHMQFCEWVPLSFLNIEGDPLLSKVYQDLIGK